MSFFFSSRRRHTRSTRDWSSDVSLPIWQEHGAQDEAEQHRRDVYQSPPMVPAHRSEERRVGKESSSRGAPERLGKKLHLLGVQDEIFRKSEGPRDRLTGGTPEGLPQLHV